MKNHSGTTGWTIAAYAAAILFVVLAIGPAIWLIVGAFQSTEADLNSLSGPWTTDNFEQVIREGGLGIAAFNSVLVTLARAGLNVLIAALAAYPLARLTFKGREIVFVLVLATTMIPEQVIVVPMFKIAAGMGLYDTLTGAVIPFSVSAFGIFLCRQAFLAIPRDLEEAAWIDGATSLRIWWSVMIPLAMPSLALLALFSVIGAWSDLLWPLIILQSEDKFTLPVAINRMLGVFATNPRVAYAASVLAIVPIIIFFLTVQRWLKPELFGGAVKG
jgi:putative chitobiose transport system permease protein